MKIKISSLCTFILLSLFFISCQESSLETELGFDNFKQAVQQIKLNDYSLSESEMNRLVEAMSQPADDNTFQILLEVRKLNINDSEKFYKLLRIQSIKEAKANGEDIIEFENALPALDKLTSKLNEFAIQNYGTTFHNLDASTYSHLMLEAFDTHFQQRTTGVICDSYDYPRWLRGLSTSNYIDASSTTSVMNSWKDIVCDTEVRYNTTGNFVAGSTNRAYNLIDDFGGGLSGRNVSSKTYLIVGTGTAWLNGMTEGTIRREVKLVK